MNFFKRAMLSIAKKKIKSLILFVVLIIIANMVLVGLSIQTATRKSTELARQKLGSDVTLTINKEKLMEERRNNKNTQKIAKPVLTSDIADALKNNEHVTQYNYISSSFGLAKNFENVKNEESNQDTTSEEGLEKTKGMFKMKGNKFSTMPEVSFSGTITTNLLSDFKDGDSKIIEGRGITQNDTGKNVAVVETNLAKENNLKVGSKIQVSSVDENTTLEFEIVGIYEAKVNANNKNMDFLNPYNKIYMPYNIASKLSESDDSNIKNITSAVYFMDNPSNIESFKQYAKNNKIDLEKYTLDANDLLYKQMVGPIENVGSFSKTLVTTVSIAGAMILVLIIALSLKDRKYEIGVLLSLGESKFKVIFQLVIEVLLVAFIAFGTSIFTGNLAANKIGHSLLSKEVKVTQSSSMQYRDNFNGQGDMEEKEHKRMNKNKLKNADLVKDMDVSVTSKDLQKLAVIGLLIVIASASIPTVAVLRFSPKTILSKRE
ncbi:ABC transporter permease [Clostridium sp. Marseille-Q2269]|uniref:ABC transporter permease n=1 Tax=Clostridium sp. Marseille-Q2269 TaxID=2942205 RepID=UPI0020738D59|nr:ABC transporter permease [Clostridium sp. Marseille-Q2269]